MAAESGNALFGVGGQYITYKETWSDHTKKDLNFAQPSFYYYFDAYTAVWTPLIRLGMQAAYASALTGSTENLGFLDYSSYLNLVIPARPFRIMIKSEYFYQKMDISISGAGFSNHNGVRFSAGLDWRSPQGMFTGHFLIPFLRTNEKRREYIVKISYNDSQNQSNESGNEGQGMNLSLGYDHLEIPFPNDPLLPNNIHTIVIARISLTIGFRW